MFADKSYEINHFKCRVMCLTEKFNNPLMWAHYADSHTGFCAGYSRAQIEACSDRLEKIVYKQNPTEIDVNNMKIEDVENLLFVKSEAWKYEEEWRAIYRMKGIDITCSQKREDIGRYYTESEDKDNIYMLSGQVQLNNYAVLAAPRYKLLDCNPHVIYLGLKMAGAERKKIIDICRSEGIEVRQMLQSENSFELLSKAVN